ncbi:hypothetical protein SO802_009438 [Lithocarpus litseifolius]|uniref:PPM-type phosphatase domain-containing protein n=1 Tax=Lithocarpus litseifolius TaxID=425828 RepID=A0AAW2DFR5_9ROSI
MQSLSAHATRLRSLFQKRIFSGSTATVALLIDGKILIANVGDSKALFFAQRKFSLVKGTGDNEDSENEDEDDDEQEDNENGEDDNNTRGNSPIVNVKNIHND